MKEEMLFQKLKNNPQYKFYKYRLWQATVFPYYFITTSWPALFLKNWKRKKLYQKYAQPLDALQARIVQDLERDGISFTHIDELFMDKSIGTRVFNEVKGLTGSKLPVHHKKVFWRDFILPEHMSDFANPFIQLAIQPRLLEILGGYFQMLPRYREIYGSVTVPVLAGTPAMDSQRWHRDPGVHKMCKVFLYLSDVDEGSGPFTYVRGSQPGGALAHICPHRFFGKGSYYPPDGAVEKGLFAMHAEDKRIICVGRAGTVIFCNTMGLHRGGYATTRERIMVQLFYKYVGAKSAPRDRFTKNFEKIFHTLPPLSQRALEQE